ncbi:MAG TPA: hypothetical protein VEW03_08490 [Longimicrobiaceae bacterium]|nr:hypothetical protein [Longimicrobiaceae bacterium]
MSAPGVVRFAIAVGMGAMAGCAPAVRPATSPGSSPVRLVDSIPWSSDMSEGVLHRIEVRYGSRVDTIPRVHTYELPLLASNGRIIGFAYQQDQVTSAFEYHPRSRELRVRALPPDLNPVFSAPALAPDGRHLAYVVIPGDGTGWAMVRTWPRLGLVVQSAPVQVPATDSPGNLVRWLSQDAFEVYVETGYATDEAWLRVRGSVRRRSASADTVHVLPAR